MAQKIPNNYLGKTARQIWDGWTGQQRSHFLFDHQEIINSVANRELSSKELFGFIDVKYVDLPEYIWAPFGEHIGQGQYAKGGSLDDLNSLISEINEAGGGQFSLGGAYGNYELWAKDKDGGDYRIEVGTKKDIYQALIKNRYNKKYNPNYDKDIKAKGGIITQATSIFNKRVSINELFEF